LDGIFSDWLGTSAPGVANDLSEAFGGHLQWDREWKGVKQGVHVQPGLQCNSLVAIRVPKANIWFAGDSGKLQATVDDGVDKYRLTVSSKVLKEAFRRGGVAAANNALPARDRLHVRVGLARPFRVPPRCYAMLNGVL
jgi:hypothetical protein